MSADNKALVQTANEAMRTGDMDAFFAACTEDFTWTIVGEETVVGKDAVREYMGKAPGSMPPFTVEATIAEGDTVVAKGVMTMPEKGVDVPYAFCDVWTVRGGQLAALNAYVVKTDKVAKGAAAGSSR